MSESQKKAVCWMWYNTFDSCRGGVLTDSVANNVVQVTQFLHGLCLPRLVYKCLLVVPTQAVDIWVSALLQLAPRVRVAEYTGPQRERRLAQVLQLGGIVVTTYGIAMNDLVSPTNLPGSDGNVSRDESNVWDVIVFDQADRLKDSSSKTTESLSQLQGNVNLLLTAHPILKHPKDLYTLFDFACEADIFGSYEQFKDRFETPISRSLGKRADDMDRQLAAMARIQLSNMIHSQYWQNWQEIQTPGGSKKPDILPAFCSTPTPFKDRTNRVLNDPTSTPSFAKTKTTSKTSTAAKKTALGDLTTPGKPGRATKSKKAVKNKPLLDDVIVLDDNDPLPSFGLQDLEDSISKLSDLTLAVTPGAKGSSSNPIHIDYQDTTPPRPFRRTPIRNAFFVSAASSHTPTKLGPQVDEEVPSPSFSTDIIKARQRDSFGRISLLDEGNGSGEQEESVEFCDFEAPTFSTPLKASNSGLGSRNSSVSKVEMKKSLTSMQWPSTESFLRRRTEFAQKLFVELNKVIFSARLPMLELKWRKMKNCAGIYHYKDSSITLNSEMLSNSSRLTSTLAHEMAHAATHLLDNCPNDRHGPVWQKWARIGHARYPSVVTGSVYHDYCSQNQALEESDH